MAKDLGSLRPPVLFSSVIFSCVIELVVVVVVFNCKFQPWT